MTELNFTEVEPFGSQDAGYRDLGQYCSAWSRRFSAEITGDQTYWAIVEIVFYQVQLFDASLQLIREEIYSICDAPTGGEQAEEFSDVAYISEGPGDTLIRNLARQRSDGLVAADVKWPAQHDNKIELWQHI